MLLDLLVDDQDVGLRRMRAGEVAGCLCASAEPVAGARSLLLGSMRYVAVARPEFISRYFPTGVNPQTLGAAPAVVFGPDDQLQHRFLQAQGFSGQFLHHLCPSSEGFVKFLCAGVGWGMVPALQVEAELDSGELVELVPGQSVKVPLYWHYWRNGGSVLAELTDQLAKAAPRWLASD